jgi:hypothetical protein
MSDLNKVNVVNVVNVWNVECSPLKPMKTKVLVNVVRRFFAPGARQLPKLRKFIPRLPSWNTLTVSGLSADCWFRSCRIIGSRNI